MVRKVHSQQPKAAGMNEQKKAEKKKVEKKQPQKTKGQSEFQSGGKPEAPAKGVGGKKLGSPLEFVQGELAKMKEEGRGDKIGSDLPPLPQAPEVTARWGGETLRANPDKAPKQTVTEARARTIANEAGLQEVRGKAVRHSNKTYECAGKTKDRAQAQEMADRIGGAAIKLTGVDGDFYYVLTAAGAEKLEE